MKRLLSVLCAAVLSLFLCAPALAGDWSAAAGAIPAPENAASGDAWPAAQEPAITVSEIQKHGNLVLSVSGCDLFARGFDWGDVVDMTINGRVFEMPIGSSFSDVNQGDMICRVEIREDTGEDSAVLAVNMGDFATAAGIAAREAIAARPGYAWRYCEGVAEPVEVSIEMKQPGGYRDQWLIHQLWRSECREDYPALTDAEFANFRMIQTGDIAAGRLYRSSSPVNPKINRSAQADAAAAEAGVRTFINLADDEQTMRGYEGFDGSYYSGQDIVALNLTVHFDSDDFRAGLAEGLRFMASHEGPYLVHCTQGKDRAGFVAAILECLMGADERDIVADYMLTYHNFYGVEPGTDQYEFIADSNIRKSLRAALGLESLEGADLRACAQAYLRNIGMTPDEIDALRANLGE